MAIRAVCAYRHDSSYEAACILVGTASWDLVADALAHSWRRRRGDAEEEVSDGDEVEGEEESWWRCLRSQVFLEWKERLDEPSAGHRTMSAVGPILEKGVDRRHGIIIFHLAQILTGHGCFGRYLWKVTVGGGLTTGRIIAELRYDVVPKTAENIRALCTGEKGIGIKGKPLHYKGVRFHKAISQFMIQGGDIINGDGTGSESIYGLTFEDENFELKHKAGVLSMANAGKPHTNGSQFCITTVPCPHLDGTNVVFGHLVAGAGLVAEIQQTAKDGRPTVECVIEDCGEIKELDNWTVCCRDGSRDHLPDYPADLRDQLSVEELITGVSDVKECGNGFFAEGLYKRATRKYLKCLRYLEFTESQLQPSERDKYYKTLDIFNLQCYLNLAACYSKLGDFSACIKSCNEVLLIEATNEKALYRRGQAYFALKNYEAALTDLRMADKMAPKNKAVQKLLDEVRRTNKKYNDMQKQRLSKLFREQKEKELGHH